MKQYKAILSRTLIILLTLTLLFSITACGTVPSGQTDTNQNQEAQSEDAGGKEANGEEIVLLDEYASYDSKEDVALYLWTYGHLPSNYMTKSEAKKLGWENGSLEKYAPGMAIGGDRFGNYEGILPEDQKYQECDIDTLGANSRGAKRIVFASDISAIYYTEDHYESFELLYGEE